MNIDKMLIPSWPNGCIIRFKYYGDFETIKLIYNECKNYLRYIGTSDIDASPVFEYYIESIDFDLLKDIKELNIYLRRLKLRNLTKRDLDENELSLLTFLRFFMYNEENAYIKGVSTYEVNYDYTSTSS